jgi:TRAP-type C4-dicarboxylate transport system substrate-binding protein
MQKKYSHTIILVIVMLSVLFVTSYACSAPSPSQPSSPLPQPTIQEPEPITLKFAYTVPKKVSISVGWEWWGEELAKRTDGRIEVEYYPGGTLFAGSATLDSVASGVADIANLSLEDSRFQLTSVVSLPALGISDSYLATGAADVDFLNMYKKFPELQAEFDGYKLLWYNQLADYQIVSKKKLIRVPSDLKGKKIGGTGDKMKIIDSAGGVTVNLIPPDAYMNLDKNVVDAFVLNWIMSYIYKIDEVCEYFLDYGVGSSGLAIIMDIDSWNKIPEDDQKLMMDLWPEAAKFGLTEDLKLLDAGKKHFQESSTVVVPTAQEIEKWEQVAEPIWNKWVEDNKAKGLKSAEAVFSEWKQIVEDSRK